MNKMKGFVSKHRSKMLIALMAGGMILSVNSGSVNEPTVTYANDFQNGQSAHNTVRGNDVFADSLLSQHADDIVEVSNVIFEAVEYDHDNPSKENPPVSGIVHEVFTLDGKLVARGQTDDNGRFVVKDLPYGHYKWLHVSVPDRYEPMDDYSYFSMFSIDEAMEIQGYLIIKQSDERPLYDSEGNAYDDEGNRLDQDGNIIPEKEEAPPEREPKEDDDSSDEPQRDGNGNIIGDDGNLYDDDGNRVNGDGHFIDEDDRLINSNGHLVDRSGNLIDEDGHLVDKEGRRVDKDGYFIGAEKEELTVNNKESSDADKSVSSNDDGKSSKGEVSTRVDTVEGGSKEKVESEPKVVSEEVSEVEEVAEESNDGQVNPDDVQTYDKGVTGFVLLALSGFGGVLVLNRQKKNA